MLKKVGYVIGILIILSLLAIPLFSYAQQSGTVIMDGEDVLQTVEGTIYVGQGVAINGNWITIFHVRFPVFGNGEKVGAATFPAEKVKIVYHKGDLNAVQQAPTTPPEKQPEKDSEIINTW